MPSRLTIFRLAALIILLLTGVELIACEVVSPMSCEVSGAPVGGSTGDADACICCCFHIVVQAPLVFEPSDEAITLEVLPRIRLSSRQPAGVYHPPRV